MISSRAQPVGRCPRQIGTRRNTRMHRLAARCALAALTALAASPAAAQTVDDIVARHVEARGGYQRLKAIETIKFTRTVATPFTDLKVVVYRKRPHLFRL